MALLGTMAWAHRFAPSALTIVQLNDAQYSVTWKTPLQSISAEPLRVELPAQCTEIEASLWLPEGTGRVRQLRVSCSDSLVGTTIRVHGLPQHQTSVVLSLHLAQGIQHQAVLTPQTPTFTVPSEPSPLQVVTRYTVVGAEHIWGGIDHLLFVMGLFILVGTGRRLVITITAFTLGHSITLVMVTLGVFRYPVPFIEFLIAASVLLLAVELTRPSGSSRLWRSPWWLAGAFGLLHGMGFAGALAATGLPQGHAPLALLFFNVGIELGQLAFIALLWAGWSLAARLAPVRPVALDQLPVLVLGALSAMWCLERGLEMITQALSL
jgi:hydrogenase/urease accessory protein HupE